MNKRLVFLGVATLFQIIALILLFVFAGWKVTLAIFLLDWARGIISAMKKDGIYK